MLAGAEVKAALQSKMQDLGYSALVYRDENDAITEAEVPAVLIQQAGQVQVGTIEGTAGGTVTHLGSFFLSFAATAQDEAETMLATATAALLEDYTLGGKVQEVVPVSYGEEAQDGKDIAALVLELNITFCTAWNDWATLI